jgi:hypothetical protein
MGTIFARQGSKPQGIRAKTNSARNPAPDAGTYSRGLPGVKVKWPEKPPKMAEMGEW